MPQAFEIVTAALTVHGYRTVAIKLSKQAGQLKVNAQ